MQKAISGRSGKPDYAAVAVVPMRPESVAFIRKLTTWEGINNPWLVVVRIATHIAEKDRPALNELCAGLEKERTQVDGKKISLLQDMHIRLTETAEMFHELAEFLENADTRLLAGACGMAEHEHRRRKAA